ncbi:ParB N-terminal domain-containing protein [uncultured Lactobacillus sp.]|uniref:ParB N-terminal domain-containing protein n=1 Tax=uncultured Lactobacillus sp. TaxID=153152 RepID=UPI0026053DF8|nr:ParB N-terminal domain-containing protein [uncultured Lactobacillus sp.]
MKVEAKSIDDIKPYENNPRDNDDAVDAVANSIKEFGWQQPIVVDIGGVIIAGHTRYKAAKKLGLKTVPVVVAKDLTEEQVKAYRLADNKSGELADWDFGKLNTELQVIDDLDMTKFGFDESDLKLADGWDDSGSLDDYDEPEEESNDETMYKCPECGYEGAPEDFKS